MPVTIELPDRLVQDLQDQAALEGVALADLLSDLLSHRRPSAALDQGGGGYVALPLVQPRYPDPLRPITGRDLDELSVHDHLSS